MKIKQKTFTMYMPEGMLKKIEEIVRSTDSDKSKFIRRAIEEKLAKLQAVEQK